MLTRFEPGDDTNVLWEFDPLSLRFNARWQSGYAGACKATERRFDSGSGVLRKVNPRGAGVGC